MRTRHVALSALIASLTFALAMPASTSPADQISAAVSALTDPARLAQVTGAATAPGAPKVSVNWVRSTEANFSWSTPTGGSAITGHILRVATGGVVVDEKKWDARTSIWISDLRPGTTYQLRIAAVNAIGTGTFTTYSFTTPLTSVERLFGASRLETAVQVSRRSFPEPGVRAAFVVNGLDFPDALAAAAAAGALGAPVLLTNPSDMPGVVGRELSALAPDYLFVAGGPGPVSDAVAAQASELATVQAYRLFGQNRYGTAEDIATLWGSSDVVYLASGRNFPDALAGAAAAGAVGAPVLLTEHGALPAETRRALAALRPSTIRVLGGTGVISPAVVSAAVASTGVQTTPVRLAGADRFQTAVEISKATFKEPGVPAVYIASGSNFADALAGAAAAGHRGGPVLLTPAGSIPSAVLDEVRRLRPQWVVVLGGPTVISDDVMSKVFAAAAF